MNHEDYWRECISNAAEECGALLTSEQVNEIAGSVQGAHENYGMAFYSPPSSDRISTVEREGNAKLARLQAEFDAYRENAETAVKRALRQRRDANVTIEKNGEVLRWGGRVEQIQ